MAAADEVLFEAQTSAFGGDVDDSGRRVVVLADRIEVRDARGRVRTEVAICEIAQVEARRRLSSAVLRIVGRDGTVLEIKGVKPAAAAQLRDTVAGLRLPLDTSPKAATPTAIALRRIDELAAMGLLTDAEVAAKRTLIAQGNVT